MDKKKLKKETIKKSFMKRNSCQINSCHAGHGVYGLGFVGAAIYFISTATGFWMGVLGLLKAIVWPVFLVYGVLKFIGM